MHPLSNANLKKDWPGRQRGAVAILLTFALIALLVMAGVALEGGHITLNKARLQNAVDAAALSGAKTLGQAYGAIGADAAARDAALLTLRLNAEADGNGELATAISSVKGAGNFAVVEFSSNLYGPYGSSLPNNSRYVRVTVERYGLVGFFWDAISKIDKDVLGGDGLPEKRVAAVAVAGPSPSQPCDLTPLMVCGDVSKPPSSGSFWGHEFGDLKVLKSTAWRGSGIGPGNYQLLDLLGTGGDGVRHGLAGGVTKCYSKGDEVLTKPGGTKGPVEDGFDTRFGFYGGNLTSSMYPPDLVVSYTTKANKGLELSGDEKKGTEHISFDGSPVDSDVHGNITNSKGAPIDGYNEWKERTAECIVGSGVGCKSGGVAERRIMKIVVGDCTEDAEGKKPINMLGVACFFALQPLSESGSDEIFGQFVRECSADGYPGSAPSADVGPQIIQLYKSYIGTGVPYEDS